jgi:hypothetical protein
MNSLNVRVVYHPASTYRKSSFFRLIHLRVLYNSVNKYRSFLHGANLSSYLRRKVFLSDVDYLHEFQASDKLRRTPFLMQYESR